MLSATLREVFLVEEAIQDPSVAVKGVQLCHHMPWPLNLGCTEMQRLHKNTKKAEVRVSIEDMIPTGGTYLDNTFHRSDPDARSIMAAAKTNAGHIMYRTVQHIQIKMQESRRLVAVFLAQYFGVLSNVFVFVKPQ